MCRRRVDDLALIPEKHISVCPSLRGLDDDYEEVKAAAQETSTLGAPGYSDFCGTVNSTQGETLHHILAAVDDDLNDDEDNSDVDRCADDVVIASSGVYCRCIGCSVVICCRTTNLHF